MTTVKNQTPSSTDFQYAMVVPCYNEEKRFPVKAFSTFLKNNSNTLLCLVNDGSKDKTLEVLHAMSEQFPSQVDVVDMPQNGGKSEAVRGGMFHVYDNYRRIQMVGFLDADLATKPEEWVQMAQYLDENPRYGAIVGSRISRLGADIDRNDNRSILSKIVKSFIRIILQTNFQDTQCGAKVFQRSLIPSLFGTEFKTPWLFDVEIFLRLQKKFGRTSLRKGVLEYPLLHWSEIGDSKLKLKDSIKIPMQLAGLYYNYRIKHLFETKSGYNVFDKKNAA